MDNTLSYLDKLQGDMLEQFRGKPNTEVFLRALARQLDELHQFFSDLHTLRSLRNSVGAQLNGIGDIICLSRQEAHTISRLANHEVPMDDETYRLYLIWKNNINTTDWTYRDVHRAIKMFWDRTPLYYHEDKNHPATIFFTTSHLGLDDFVDIGPLAVAPRVKAGGVALDIVCAFEPISNPISNELVFVDFGAHFAVRNGSAILSGAILNGARNLDGTWTLESARLGIKFVDLNIQFGVSQHQQFRDVDFGVGFGFLQPQRFSSIDFGVKFGVAQLQQFNSIDFGVLFKALQHQLFRGIDLCIKFVLPQELQFSSVDLNIGIGVSQEQHFSGGDLDIVVSFSNREKFSGKVVTDSLWLLDGSYYLDGAMLLNADIEEVIL